MRAQEFYDGLGDDYDRMVSWDTRLEREEAFFERLFGGERVSTLLDAACGTGMHLVAFARRGLRCSGADLSPTMVERAGENARRAGVTIHCAVAGFGGLAAVYPGPFDALTCLGNSLPHLLDDEALSRCLSDFASVLRPGGILVIQNRNYDRLLRERQRFMPVAAREDGEGETLFLRITDYPAAAEGQGAESISFTIVTLRKRDGAWRQSVRTTPLRALRRVTVESALGWAGFERMEFYGGFGGEPYDAPGTSDLVVVARRKP